MWFAPVLLRRVPQFMFWRYAESVGGCRGARSGDWECEADGPSCGTFALRAPEQKVRLTGWRMRLCSSRRPSQWSEGRGSKAVVRGLGKWHCAEARLERPCFRSCRAGESGGWVGNNQKDGREVQVWFGHGDLSGSGSAFGSCPSQGLPVRSPNASQWCRVHMRRGEAHMY